MKIDIHAHVLPGVDHGAKDWNMSLEMLARSKECGVSTVIATPHYLPWKNSVTAETICSLCEEAEQRLKEKHGISMNIHPGHEIFYSVELVEMLKEGKVLTLAGSRYVLVEFEPGVSYQTLRKAAGDLRYNRYIPIFAHIERYRCLEHRERLAELKELGALFQVNVGSFQGGFFDSESRRIKRWIKEGIVDFLASDMHDIKMRPPMSSEELKWLQRKINPHYQDKLLYSNAQKILSGRNG